MGAMYRNRAVNELKELYLNNSRIKYPTFPEYARTYPKYTDKTANGLTKCIIDYINLTGNHAERINCTGRIIDTRKTITDVADQCRTIGTIKYVKTAGQRGTADISATIQGRSVKIEVKIGADRQSEAQKQYEKSIVSSGGLYVIAKDFEQFLNWYKLTFGNYGN